MEDWYYVQRGWHIQSLSFFCRISPSCPGTGRQWHNFGLSWFCRIAIQSHFGALVGFGLTGMCAGSSLLQQSSAFYVMTNMHVTPFQKNSTCAEVGAASLDFVWVHQELWLSKDCLLSCTPSSFFPWGFSLSLTCPADLGTCGLFVCNTQIWWSGPQHTKWPVFMYWISLFFRNHPWCRVRQRPIAQLGCLLKMAMVRLCLLTCRCLILVSAGAVKRLPS